MPKEQTIVKHAALFEAYSRTLKELIVTHGREVVERLDLNYVDNIVCKPFFYSAVYVRKVIIQVLKNPAQYKLHEAEVNELLDLINKMQQR